MGSAYTSRNLLFSVIAVSIIFGFPSCLFLLRSSGTHVPESVLTRLLFNNTPVSVYQTPKPHTLANTTPAVGSQPPRVADALNGQSSSRSIAQVSNSPDSCGPNRRMTKVFMYDLPPEFHFGLLDWNPTQRNIWPDVNGKIPAYPGGLNRQHSVEYWLTLDLLSSNNRSSEIGTCTAVKVNDSGIADVIFVPFFSSLSYNRYSKVHKRERFSKNRALQERLVQFLLDRPEWKSQGGRNHLMVVHHPNSMLMARKKLGSARFIVADFGRFPANVANLDKDIVAPYRHVVPSVVPNDSLPFEKRKTLLFFEGAIYRKDGGIIRLKLYNLLKNEKDVHFKPGSVQRGGISRAGRGMASSKFCLNIVGDTPSSNRLFDAIVSHCVPVIISDNIELPFEDVRDYSEFCVFVQEIDAMKPDFVLNLLRGIGPLRWTKMSKKLMEIAHHFEYQFPSQPGDAVQMIWDAVGRKLSSDTVQLEYHRSKRFPQHQR